MGPSWRSTTRRAGDATSATRVDGDMRVEVDADSWTRDLRLSSRRMQRHTRPLEPSTFRKRWWYRTDGRIGSATSRALAPRVHARLVSTKTKHGSVPDV